MVIGLETQTLHCITREELLFNTRLLNSWSKASIFVISLHLPLTTTIGKINPQLYVLLLINSQLYICSKSSISFLPTSLMCPKRVMHESVSDIILLYVCRFLTRDERKTHTPMNQSLEFLTKCFYSFIIYMGPDQVMVTARSKTGS